ncbi:MAG: AzlC family ABC transporter permease [Clostridia bacterium]|nr:AzlC family ABC transporter permease [Clostridia bacterium]
MQSYKKGVKAGVPIGLGYLSVSFSFGIMAVSMGLHVWQAILISMTTLTSAGQLSGIGTMMIPGQYASMLVSQLTINVRYSFMSISLSQKADDALRGVWRWLLGFFITDEIFAVASTEKSVSRSYFLGLAAMPYVGWTLGTTLGALLGNVLPESLTGALCIAIYAMFVAIVVPPAKEDRRLLAVVGTAIAASLAFYYLPYLNRVSSGLSVSICAVAAAALGAWLFPRKEEDDG